MKFSILNSHLIIYKSRSEISKRLWIRIMAFMVIYDYNVGVRNILKILFILVFEDSVLLGKHARSVDPVQEKAGSCAKS